MSKKRFRSTLDAFHRTTTLHDLGWRLRHFREAKGFSIEHTATHVGVSKDHYALAELGAYQLPFVAIHAALDLFDLADFSDFYGSDMVRPHRVHDLAIDSNIWHAIDSEVQTFVIQRDTESYRVGDQLCLYERLGNKRTGRVLSVTVTYVFYFASADNLPAGYVSMAIQSIDKSKIEGLSA